MKIDILFALPGPRNSQAPDKLLVVAAATEHEDPRQLAGILSDVVDGAVASGAYSVVRKVTLELDESVVLSMLQDEPVRVVTSMPTPARLDRSMLH